MKEILNPVLILGGTGLAMGLFLAYAAKKFEIQVDPKISAILGVLPGANCGGCGFPGCGGYASAIVNDGAGLSLCAPGGGAVASKIGDIMGLTVDASGDKKTARVICQGHKVAKKFAFDGTLNTCADVGMYAGGDKNCRYACLGYGDCVRVCPVGAISVGETGIAVVNEEKCIACGLCVKACPKAVIAMTPVLKQVTVLCSSKDKGPIAKQACETACIGCSLCVKSCPKEAIVVANNLAKIDPEKCVNCGICATKCPTHAIVNNFKRPTKVAAKQPAATITPTV
jgi:electron transport complex protein RnfB